MEVNDETDFILLDIRDTEHYRDCHINESTNLSSNLIYQNRLPSDVLQFKNKENCLIILYHEFEKDGIPYITILTERGFDNVFLLSGGLQEFMPAFPHLLSGKNVPHIENTNNFQKKSKVEIYRQAQVKPKNEN